MNKLERAIVTIGGTREPIDYVRFITNFDTGRFGHEIARILEQRGYQITVFCPADVQRALADPTNGIGYINFTSAKSLEGTLLADPSPAIIFHAAAVSDFTPKEPVAGKIPSSKDELILTLVRTPKILDQLRGAYGQESFIVGFKLLSGVSRQELIQAAMEQNRRAHLSLTVANDLQDLHDGMHPVILVTAEGGAINVVGKREEVARLIVEFVRKRSQVTWYHSEKADHLPLPSNDEFLKFSALLKFAQATHLLYDESGNVSARLQNSDLIVTPRQVDKSVTQPEDACIAQVNHQDNIVNYKGEIKASIDTPVNGALYRAFPKIRSMLHFHAPWGIASKATTFPYPCGVKEEAREIFSLLGNNPQLDEFSVELLHHGFLIGLPEGGLERLQAEWAQTQAEFTEHLEKVNRRDQLELGYLKPIFAGTRIVGVLAQFLQGVVVYLTENARGQGVGKKVAQQLIERQIKVQTIEDCDVLDFYRKFGFIEQKDSQSGIYTLTPPPISQTDELFSRLEEWMIS